MDIEAVQLQHLPVDSQVLKACKYLVRLIHQRGLAVGDRLPSQDELRRSSTFSNDTLSVAMQHLASGGLLRRRVGSGTVVADADRPFHGLWTVGLALQRGIITRVPFFALLTSLVQERLSDQGCRFQLHLQLADLFHRADPLDNFHLLVHDVTEERLDGIVSPASFDLDDMDLLRERGVPLVHAGSWERAPCGAVIDRYQMTRHATRLLHEAGCREFALVSMWDPEPGDDRFWHGHLAGLSDVGLTPEHTTSVAAGDGITAGQEAGRRMLAGSARPEALIFVDDRVAMGFISVLRDDPTYRPRIVVQTNRQIPLAFALPVTRFEVDVERLANSAIAALMERIANPELPDVVDWQAPQLVNEEPSTIP